MQFIDHSENDLNQLSILIKRSKYSIVQEAIEKALIRLKVIRREYAQMLKVEEAPGPGHVVFKSHEVLRPYLLIFNHVQMKTDILKHAFSSMEKLLLWKALNIREDMRNILRVLSIQAEGNTQGDIQLKVLQNVLVLLQCYESEGLGIIEEDVFIEALNICFHLYDITSSSPSGSSSHQNHSGYLPVHSTAIAALSQIILIPFESANAQDFGHVSVAVPRSLQVSESFGLDSHNRTDEEDEHGIESEHHTTACHVLSDLLSLIQGTDPRYLKKHIRIQTKFGLELIDSILNQASELFCYQSVFLAMLREQVCPLILSQLMVYQTYSTSDVDPFVSPPFNAQVGASLTTTATSTTSGSGIIINASQSNQDQMKIVAMKKQLIIRWMRLTSTLLCCYGNVLDDQIEAILSTLIELITETTTMTPSANDESSVRFIMESTSMTSNSPSHSSTSSQHHLGRTFTESLRYWSMLGIIEALTRFCHAQNMIFTLYEQHDAQAGTSTSSGIFGSVATIDGAANGNPFTTTRRPTTEKEEEMTFEFVRLNSGRKRSRLFKRMCQTLGAFISNGNQHDLRKASVVQSKKKHNSSHGISIITTGIIDGMMSSSSSNSIPLGAVSKFHLLRAAIHCFMVLVASMERLLHAATLAAAAESGHLLGNCRRMLKTISIYALPAMASTLSFCAESEILEMILRFYTSLCCCAGMESMALWNIRDACVGALSHFAFPSHPLDRIQDKHILVIQKVFYLIHKVHHQRGFPWRVICEGFQVLDYFAEDRKQKSSGNEDIEQQLEILQQTLWRFFQPISLNQMTSEVIVDLQMAMSDLILEPFHIQNIPTKSSCGTAAASTSTSGESQQSSDISDKNKNDDKDEQDEFQFLLVQDGTKSHFLNYAKYISSATSGTAGTSRSTFPFLFQQFIVMNRMLIAEENMSQIGWDLTMQHLLLLSLTTNTSPIMIPSNYRLYCCDAMIQFIISVLKKSATTAPEEEAAVKADTILCMNQKQILAPLENSMSACVSASISESSALYPVYEKLCTGMHEVIYSCGPVFQETTWCFIFQVLESIVKEKESLDSHPSHDHHRVDREDHTGTTRLSVNNEASVGGGQNQPANLGFKCIQLILDHYLEILSIQTLYQYFIPCVRFYAQQQQDINISLTAIGQLWTFSDWIHASTTDSDANILGTQTHTQQHIMKETKLKCWNALFCQFQMLIFDARPEVRNCAVDTLFRTVISHGTHFDGELWKRCIVATIFPITVQMLDDHHHQPTTVVSHEDAPEQQSILNSLTGSVGDHHQISRRLKDRSISIHHSRNTLEKQWNETIVLFCTGLNRVFKSFFIHIESLAWFTTERIWTKLILIFRQMILGTPASSPSYEASTEIALAGLQCFSTFIHISSQASSSCSSSSSSSMSTTGPLWKEAWINMKAIGYECCFRSTIDEELVKGFVKHWMKIYESSKSYELTLVSNDSYFGTSVGRTEEDQEEEEESRILLYSWNQFLSQDLFHHLISSARQQHQKLCLSGVHLTILAAYRSCSPFPSTAPTVYVETFRSFQSVLVTSSPYPFVWREILTTASAMYDARIPTLERRLILQTLVPAVHDFFQTLLLLLESSSSSSNNDDHHLLFPSSSERRVAREMWKHIAALVLKFIQFGFPALVVVHHHDHHHEEDETTTNDESKEDKTITLWQDVMAFIIPFLTRISSDVEISSDESKAEEDQQICISVLDSLVLVLRELLISPNGKYIPTFVQQKVIHFIASGASSSSCESPSVHKRFTQACFQHLTLVCGDGPSSSKTGDVFSTLALEYLLKEFEQTLDDIWSCYSENEDRDSNLDTTAIDMLENLSQCQFFALALQSLVITHDKIMILQMTKIYRRCCDAITHPDVRVRKIIQHILQHANMMEILLHE